MNPRPDLGTFEGAAAEIRGVITGTITAHPRSKQKRIGPSEIGTPCDHCLAAKLAGWEQTEIGIPWLPAIGTAMHEWLEMAVLQYEVARMKNTGDTTNHFFCEAKVDVGEIRGQHITGSCDLFHVPSGTVIDYKLVGATTLRQAKASGPSDTYRAQAHLYGRGWARDGQTVNHVAIFYLPRNSVNFDDAYLWHEPWNETIALTALERANRIAANIDALETVSEQARDQWITSLPRDSGCWNCNRYPDSPARGHKNKTNDLPIK